MAWKTCRMFNCYIIIRLSFWTVIQRSMLPRRRARHLKISRNLNGVWRYWRRRTCVGALIKRVSPNSTAATRGTICRQGSERALPHSTVVFLRTMPIHKTELQFEISAILPLLQCTSIIVKGLDGSFHISQCVYPDERFLLLALQVVWFWRASRVLLIVTLSTLFITLAWLKTSHDTNYCSTPSSGMSLKTGLPVCLANWWVGNGSPVGHPRVRSTWEIL